VLGCALAVYVNKVFGRKRSLAFLSMLSIIGIVIEMTSALGSSPAGRFGQFIAGKLINSMAMGMACNIIPIYLSETSTASARGSVINMYNLVQITGVIVASASVYAVSTRSDRSAYLIPMGIQLVSPGLILIVYYWLPESPRWLIWVG
jgi:SP family sugar:H+ symporter-like MFS transporter